MLLRYVLQRSDMKHVGSKDSKIIDVMDKTKWVTRRCADGSFTRGHLAA